MLLRDVARAELGTENNEISSFYNGKRRQAWRSSCIRRNALETAELVKAKMADLGAFLPPA